MAIATWKAAHQWTGDFRVCLECAPFDLSVSRLHVSIRYVSCIWPDMNGLHVVFNTEFRLNTSVFTKLYTIWCMDGRARACLCAELSVWPGVWTQFNLFREVGKAAWEFQHKQPEYHCCCYSIIGTIRKHLSSGGAVTAKTLGFSGRTKDELDFLDFKRDYIKEVY